VGLSLGLTPELSEVGRWIIICAMFLGRLGPLTFVVLLVETSEPEYRYPEEQLLIG
jgi:trk system potassium uptake protein TrkH